MRDARRIPAALSAMLALGVLAGCAPGPDPDRAQWQEWIDATDPSTADSDGGGAGFAGTVDEPALLKLSYSSDPIALTSIALGCTGSGTMSFAITLTPAADGTAASFEHDVVCSDAMGTPLATPTDIDTVSEVEVAVTSDDGRGAWRITLDPPG